MSTQGTAAAPVTVRGEGLGLADVVRVARRGAAVKMSDEVVVMDRLRASREAVEASVASGEAIYGVTTVFGGMANLSVAATDAADLQNNIAWPHKTGAGPLLPAWAVRAAMILRVNSLLRGASGVRPELIQRYVDCLNADITPEVPEMGSIGASGDLVPLSYILGSVIGLGPEFRVTAKGRSLDAVSALAAAGMAPLRLTAKEGLSAINGTSVMTGIAAGVVRDARVLLAAALGAHALMAQGLRATMQSFHPFIHEVKPHPGQIWCAERMRDLLEGSHLVREAADGARRMAKNDLVQDRYSLRCLPQYLGPVVDGLAQVTRQVAVEANSATDNPLIDPSTGASYFCGNFLGQYIGTAMDQWRYLMGLMAKHLDVQMALLVAPEFNGGLPPSLVGNPERRVNIGLKGLQISGNSIMPLLSFYGNSLVDRFPTHAEQFNQNVNSLGFGSAVLAMKSQDILRQYMSIALIFGVQAVDLRTRLREGHCDARRSLSPATARLYEAVREVVGVPPSPDRPYLFNDDEQALDAHMARIAADIASGGKIPGSLTDTSSAFGRFVEG